MKKWVIRLFALLISFISKAQIAPSPDAMSYLHTNSTEDLYRGYITENVPLYTVAANNGHKVPVSVNYQTKGIKVHDIASSVGLGWNLNAGGAITRVMRSQPDDNSLYYNDLDEAIVKDAVDRSKKGFDFEKDIFYYSYPGGSGKFVNVTNSMGYGGAPTATLFYGLPYTDNRIEFNYGDPTHSSWVITDANGIKYHFGTTEESREITNSSSYEEGKSPKENAELTYISTWYLTRIEYPDLPAADDIVFTYELAEDPIQTSETSISKTYELEKDHVVIRTWQNDLSTSFDINALVYQDAGSSTFDIYGWINLSLFSEIYVGGPVGGPTWGYPYQGGAWSIEKSVVDKLCSEYPQCAQQAHAIVQREAPGFNWTDFPVQAFVDGDEFNVRGHQIYRKPETPETTNFISDVSINTARLTSIKSRKSTVNFIWGYRREINKRLDRIEVLDHSNKLVNTFQLSYDYFRANNCSGDYLKCERLKLIEVFKNGASLASFAYYDEVSSGYNLPARTSNKIDRYGYYNSSVNSLFPSVSFNTIQRVVYDQTKADYNAPLLNYGPATINISGSQRGLSDKAKANILWKVNLPQGGRKEFSYSVRSGGGVKIDNVSIFDENSNLVGSKSYSFESPRRPSAALNTPLLGASVTLFSHSPYLYFDYAENTGYGKVTVTDDILGSKIIHESYSGSFKDYSRKTLRKSNWQKEEDLKESLFPYLPPLFSPYFGMPKKTIYKDENGVTYKEDVYSYEFGDTEYTYNEHSVFKADNGKYVAAESTQSLRPFYLKGIQSTSTENGVVIRTQTDFNYHNSYKTLVRSKETYEVDSDGEKVDRQEVNHSLVQYWYPMDGVYLKKKHSQTVLNEMVTKNIIGSPIQMVNAVKYPDELLFDVTAASVTTFRKQHTFIKPYQVYTTVLNSPVAITTWGASNLDLRTTMNFNDKGLLLSEKNSDDIESIYDYDSRGYLKSKVIDPGPDDLQRRTSYTYKYLVGPKSITNPNGRKTSYVYDDRNRLHLVKNNEGHIVERYRYNLASETTSGNLRATISTSSGYNVVNQFVGMTANVYGNSYGEPGYEWGNGKTGKNVSYRWDSPGEYTVSVKVTNPDHPDIETSATRTITIYQTTATYSLDANLGENNEVELCTSGGTGEQFEQSSHASATQTVEGNDGSYPFVWVRIEAIDNGATCQDFGYKTASLSYKNHNGSWIQFSNSSSGELPEEAFRYRAAPFDIEINGEYRDNCSTITHTPSMIVRVVPCTSNSGGTGGSGNGDTGDGTGDGPIEPTDEFLDPGGQN